MNNMKYNNEAKSPNLFSYYDEKMAICASSGQKKLQLSGKNDTSKLNLLAASFIPYEQKKIVAPKYCGGFN